MQRLGRAGTGRRRESRAIPGQGHLCPSRSDAQPLDVWPTVILILGTPKKPKILRRIARRGTRSQSTGVRIVRRVWKRHCRSCKSSRWIGCRRMAALWPNGSGSEEATAHSDHLRRRGTGQGGHDSQRIPASRFCSTASLAKEVARVLPRDIHGLGDATASGVSQEGTSA